jgi:hypothetical protein
MERPSALAVLRLMTVSNFEGCWIGSSDGFLALSDTINMTGKSSILPRLQWSIRSPQRPQAEALLIQLLHPRVSSVGGMLTPSALAALRLMTSSYSSDSASEDYRAFHLGSQTDIAASAVNVRFCPNSGHDKAPDRLPLRAQIRDSCAAAKDSSIRSLHRRGSAMLGAP